MRTLKTILLATDFRSSDQEAANTTIQLATAFGSAVTLLHVLEPMPHLPAAWHERKEQVEKALKELAARLSAEKVQVAQSSVVVGAPADTIVRKAAEIDADLLVIGAGELSRFERFSVGPIATMVIEHAVPPVLAVRPGGPATRFKRVLCAVDQSNPAARGLRNAIRLVRAFGGQLLVLTVVPAVTPEVAAGVTGSFADEQTKFDSLWRGEFMKVLGESDLSDIAVTKEVRYGLPHRQIIAAAQEFQADLIVMGTTGRTGLARVLVGSTTRRVFEHLPCSLLTTKAEDVVEEVLDAELQAIKQLLAEGRKLVAAGAYPEASVKFRQVLSHNPFHVAAVEGLAEAYEKLGQKPLAEYYRQRAEKLRKSNG